MPSSQKVSPTHRKTMLDIYIHKGSGKKVINILAVMGNEIRILIRIRQGLPRGVSGGFSSAIHPPFWKVPAQRGALVQKPTYHCPKAKLVLCEHLMGNNQNMLRTCSSHMHHLDRTSMGRATLGLFFHCVSYCSLQHQNSLNSRRKTTRVFNEI